MTDPIHQALALGQSIWYDGIRRSLLTSGKLERMVTREGLRGMTSNPSIFDKAIAGSSDYDAAIAELRRSGPIDAKSAYESLAIADIRAATDIFGPVYDESGGSDGYVSMEVSPELAHDTAATVAEAKRLWASIDRPNLMVKVPGTAEGIPAIQELIGAAINVNVTLLFGLEAYELAAQAYLAGLEDRLAGGGEIAGIASVASVFVSRLDSAVEPHLDRAFAGKVAIANAKLIYARSRTLTSSERWEALAGAGAGAQRLLWASTSTKNPALPELLYVESLIGSDTVDTVPPATYEAFAAHGTVRPTLAENLDHARRLLDELPGHGIELAEVLDQLLAEGVEKFSDAFRQLLSSVEHALSGETEKQRPGRLRRSLPRDIDDQVDAAIDEWRATGKVARVWAHDATVWTGSDEDAWLGWLGVALDQGSPRRSLREADRRGAERTVHRRGSCSAWGIEPMSRRAGPHLHPTVRLSPPSRARLHRPRAGEGHGRQGQPGPHAVLRLIQVRNHVGTEHLRHLLLSTDVRPRGARQAGSHFVAITDPASPLESLAREQGYRAVFHGVPSIGGRYSALSDFGMVPGAACGVDVARLFSSAETMAHACAPSVPAGENPRLELGAVIATCVNAGRDKVTLLTSPGIATLGPGSSNSSPNPPASTAGA